MAAVWVFGELSELFSLHFASSASSVKRKSKLPAFRCEALLIAVALSVYVLNRFTPIFEAVLPFDFVRYHFNDMLGGIVFPAYVNAILILSKYRLRFKSLPKISLIEAICAFAWEGLAPLVLTRSTGDWLDVCCYFLGGLIYFLISKIILRTRKKDHKKMISSTSK